MMSNGLTVMAERLWKDPSEKNWEVFGRSLAKNGAKYYSIVFSKVKLVKKDDLREAYAEIFSANGQRIARVPVFKSKGKGIEGATIYLKGLLNINR